jgi:hypothetical protein
MAKRALSKGEKKLLTIAVIFVVLIGAVGYGLYSINVNPVISIPTPAMPSPNARDFYLDAHALKVDTLGTPVGKPAHGLTVDTINRCIEAGIIVPDPQTKSGAMPWLADMKALTAANAPVIAKVREGFSHEYREPPARSFNHLFPQFSQYRSLARVMMADARVECASGDWNGGADRMLDVVRLGHDIPRGGPLIGDLVGIAIRAMGYAEIWAALDHISGPAARHAARRLEEMSAGRVSYADVLQEEKWGTQAAMLEMFNTPNWRRSQTLFQAGDGGMGGSSASTFLRMQVASKRAIMEDYNRHMDAVIAQSRQPFAARGTAPPRPMDPVSSIFAPVFAKGRWKHVMADSQTDLLTVSFALRAYKADHGNNPADLNALVPTYLKAVPADSFTATDTLKYKVTGNSYALYSVGPDGKDDGGTPSADGKKSVAGGNTNLNTRSTGDIVAGINTH